MHLTDLALDDFRSYRHVVTRLSGGINVFLGKNGQGKTNLVEAVAYLSTFSSHRVAADTALVRIASAGEPTPSAGVIRARAVEDGHEKLLEVEIVRGKANRARLNRGSIRPKELLGIVRTVVFAPEDLQIVRGDPAGRRRFVDDLVVQLQPMMAPVYTEHDKILRQRSALLRTAGKNPASLSTLDVWDAHLAQVAAKIIAARARVVQSLAPLLVGAHAAIADDARDLNISYQSSLAGKIAFAEADLLDQEIMEEKMGQALALLRPRELERGVNLVGAHRDDIFLALEQMPVKGYASHGETWSTALALRLAAFALLKDDGSEPILILDDVFAELDAHRRASLAKVMQASEQVIVTAAVGEDLPEIAEATYFDVTFDSDEGTQIERRDG